MLDSSMFSLQIFTTRDIEEELIELIRESALDDV